MYVEPDGGTVGEPVKSQVLSRLKNRRGFQQRVVWPLLAGQGPVISLGDSGKGHMLHVQQGCHLFSRAGQAAVKIDWVVKGYGLDPYVTASTRDGTPL